MRVEEIMLVRPDIPSEQRPTGHGVLLTNDEIARLPALYNLGMVLWQRYYEVVQQPVPLYAGRSTIKLLKRAQHTGRFLLQDHTGHTYWTVDCTKRNLGTLSFEIEQLTAMTDPAGAGRRLVPMAAQQLQARIDLMTGIVGHMRGLTG